MHQKFWSLYLLIIIFSISCCYKQTNIKYIIIPNKNGYIEQTVYVDSSFDDKEFEQIELAASEWTSVSKGRIKFIFNYPYLINDYDFASALGKNVIVKASSNHPFVVQIDKKKEIEFKNKIYGDLGVLPKPPSAPIASGLWQYNNKDGYWYIGLIYDRIHSLFELKIVAMHEFGHALNLDHDNNKIGIMNSTASMASEGCLKKHDVEQYAKIYKLDILKLNYCE